ncbi:MAG TPA: Tim44/TimA family putative adaptor protein [Acetobacteraceae bacterium]|jgi:predicted lipid-binding transport protein (Tim44 family)|nr:Tim44/TimA family putative adaptor protein [Acetobacteraceae bacterium]
MPPHYRRPADAAIPTPVRAVSFVLRAPPTYLCIYGGEKLDMGGGGFPIDLVLFGMIAAFLVLRLRSILGRRTGYERPPQPYQPPTGPAPHGPVIDGHAEPVPAATRRTVPEPVSALGQTLARMQAVDRSFDPAGFLDGAEKAFRLIVAAFASGDRATLRNLLADDTYRAFDQAISAREAAGHQQVSEIRAVPGVGIEEAELNGTIAHITVKFVSDQISLTRDQAGNPVAGTDAVTEITDLWMFERDLSSRDPAWRLVAARSA